MNFENIKNLKLNFSFTLETVKKGLKVTEGQFS